MKSRSVDCSWNWSPFCPPFRVPRPLPPPPQKTSSDFSCGKILRGRPRFTHLAALTSALIPNRNVAAPPDWPLVRLIVQLENCVPFLIPLADQAIGRGYPLVTLQLIRLSKNTLPPSPRNKQKQGFLLAKRCHFSSTSSLNCVLIFATEHFYHLYPRWKGTSSVVI